MTKWHGRQERDHQAGAGRGRSRRRRADHREGGGNTLIGWLFSLRPACPPDTAPRDSCPLRKLENKTAKQKSSMDAFPVPPQQGAPEARTVVRGQDDPASGETWGAARGLGLESPRRCHHNPRGRSWAGGRAGGMGAACSRQAGLSSGQEGGLGAPAAALQGDREATGSGPRGDKHGRGRHPPAPLHDPGPHLTRPLVPHCLWSRPSAPPGGSPACCPAPLSFTWPSRPCSSWPPQLSSLWLRLRTGHRSDYPASPLLIRTLGRCRSTEGRRPGRSTQTRSPSLRPGAWPASRVPPHRPGPCQSCPVDTWCSVTAWQLPSAPQELRNRTVTD